MKSFCWMLCLFVISFCCGCCVVEVRIEHTHNDPIDPITSSVSFKNK